MDLSGQFVAFAQLGASWVLWLLVALSVLSIGIMIDRALWMRGKNTDVERQESASALCEQHCDEQRQGDRKNQTNTPHLAVEIPH